MSTKAHPDYGNTNGIKEWKLRLFVTDWTPRCVVAYKNLNRICAERLKDRCKIEVIDLLEKPEIARQEQIVAVPTLMKTSPKPEKIMIGDFTDEERVLKALGVEPEKRIASTNVLNNYSCCHCESSPSLPYSRRTAKQSQTK